MSYFGPQLGIYIGLATGQYWVTELRNWRAPKHPFVRQILATFEKVFTQKHLVTLAVADFLLESGVPTVSVCSGQ